MESTKLASARVKGILLLMQIAVGGIAAAGYFDPIQLHNTTQKLQKTSITAICSRYNLLIPLTTVDGGDQDG